MFQEFGMNQCILTNLKCKWCKGLIWPALHYCAMDSPAMFWLGQVFDLLFQLRSVHGIAALWAFEVHRNLKEMSFFHEKNLDTLKLKPTYFPAWCSRSSSSFELLTLPELSLWPFPCCFVSVQWYMSLSWSPASSSKGIGSQAVHKPHTTSRMLRIRRSFESELGKSIFSRAMEKRFSSRAGLLPVTLWCRTRSLKQIYR